MADRDGGVRNGGRFHRSFFSSGDGGGRRAEGGDDGGVRGGRCRRAVVGVGGVDNVVQRAPECGIEMAEMGEVGKGRRRRRRERRVCVGSSGFGRRRGSRRSRSDVSDERNYGGGVHQRMVKRCRFCRRCTN